MRAAGETLALPESGEGKGAWKFEVQFFVPPADGVEFELRTAGKPRLAVSDITLGLDGVPGLRPRPEGTEVASSTGGLPGDSVTVVGRIAGP